MAKRGKFPVVPVAIGAGVLGALYLLTRGSTKSAAEARAEAIQRAQGMGGGQMMPGGIETAFGPGVHPASIVRMASGNTFTATAKNGQVTKFTAAGTRNEEDIPPSFYALNQTTNQMEKVPIDKIITVDP